jgi:hypothetical protein
MPDDYEDDDGGGGDDGDDGKYTVLPQHPSGHFAEEKHFSLPGLKPGLSSP